MTNMLSEGKYVFTAFILSVIVVYSVTSPNNGNLWLSIDELSAHKQRIENHKYWAVLTSDNVTCLIETKKTANDSLRRKLMEVIQSCNANVGVSVFHIELKDTISCNGANRFPMLSVYKYPIALTVLNRVDKKKAGMKKQVQIPSDMIHPYEKEAFLSGFPDGKASIEDLLSLMLVYGSNTACDILLKEIGGPEVANQYMRKIGVDSMAIVNTEAEIQISPDIKYKNWCTPNEMIKLFATTFKGKKISAKSYSFLWNKMTETTTGINRLKGLLPKDASVAHRTGTSGNVYNDVGIITLPNKEHVAIAVFMSEAKDEASKAEYTIALIGKLVWDYYVK